MEIIRLWGDIAAHTSVGIYGSAVSTLVVLAQMWLGAVFPLQTLYRVVRRRSKAERLLLCAVPAIFIAALCFVEPLFFGSFLGGGFRQTEALRGFVLQPALLWQVLALCGLFVLLAWLYLLVDRRAARLSWLKILFAVGFEALLVPAAVLLSLEALYGQGALLRGVDDTLLKWVVYGLYLLLNKCCLYALCLLWSALFSEHERPDDPDAPIRYERWLHRRFCKNLRVTGVGCLMLAAFYGYFALYRMLEEGKASLAQEVVFTALGAVVALFGAVALVSSFVPGLGKNYRRILSWGPLEITARRLYNELEQKPPLRRMDIGVLTEHYLVLSAPMVERVYYRPLLEACELGSTMLTYTLRFRDGGSCSVDMAYVALVRELCEGAGLTAPRC